MSSHAQLRLRIAEEDADRLLAHPLLSGALTTHEQVSNGYYDTEDLALRRLGLRLESQWVDDHWIQTLKDDDPRSPEVAHQIKGGMVDHPGLPVQGKAAKKLARILADQSLQSVFQIERERSKRDILLENGTQIAVTLDQGRIRMEDREEPFQELSLTLQSGTVQDLYGLVLELAEHQPLELEDADPAARGYELLCPQAITYHKAEPVQLPADASAEEALIIIVRVCLEHLRSNLAATRAGQAEGVHQMRVALRRLRSCLRVFNPLIPKEASADLVAEIHWLNGFLGPARDWDVFMEEGLGPICARFPDKRRLQGLHRQAEAIHQTHYQALYRCLHDPRYHRLILRLYGWLAAKSWRQGLFETQQEGLDQPIANFATPILKQAHRRVVKRGKIFAELDAEDRHALRIRIKRLRYALEFFSSLYLGQAVEDYRDALTRLQDTLGVLNDIMVVELLLDEAKLGPATPTRHLIEGWYGCKLDIYERRFPKAWKKFRGCKRPWK